MNSAALRFCFLLLAAHGLAAGAMAQEGALRDSATVQKARNAMVKGKGNRTFYPGDAFDLSGLPAYRPEGKVSGTLRLWGSNYFTDGNLGRYWEEGFRRYHPDVSFYFHLTTAAAAAFTIVPRHVLGGPGYTAPSDKLNIGCVGVNGKGQSDIQAVSTENIVALCDVNGVR